MSRKRESHGFFAHWNLFGELNRLARGSIGDTYRAFGGGVGAYQLRWLASKLPMMLEGTKWAGREEAFVEVLSRVVAGEPRSLIDLELLGLLCSNIHYITAAFHKLDSKGTAHLPRDPVRGDATWLLRHNPLEEPFSMDKGVSGT